MTDSPPTPNEQALNYLRTSSRSPEDFEARSIDQSRAEFLEECRQYGGPLETMAEISDLSIGRVPVRIYQPAGDETDALVWLHGGGWTIGSVQCFDALTRSLAVQSRCAVVSVDYRLTPEFVYPAAIDDAWSAVEWAVANFRNVAVGGDSSGGNLAASSAIRARDVGIELALQLLVYPMLDFRTNDETYRRFAEEYQDFGGIQGYGRQFREMMTVLWSRYVPDEERRVEVDASPMRAQNFRGLAPAIVIEAEHDILRNEDAEFVMRLRDSGIAVEEVIFAGQIHGFFHLQGLMPDARVALKKSATAVRKAFAS